MQVKTPLKMPKKLTMLLNTCEKGDLTHPIPGGGTDGEGIPAYTRAATSPRIGVQASNSTKICPRERQGKNIEFRQLWIEMRDKLYRCCLKLMNFNPADAEDALSSAMLKAIEKLEKFAGRIVNLKAWLMVVTRNVCIDIIRENSRGPVGVESIEWVGNTEEMEFASSVASPESVLEREEISIEIRRAIADLPERQRETFILHFYRELSHTEIAQQQGISYGSVCKRISMARKNLKRKLSSYFMESELEDILGVPVRGKSQSPAQKIEHDVLNGLETAIASLDKECPLVAEAETPELVEGAVEPDVIVGENIMETANLAADKESIGEEETEKPELVDCCLELASDGSENIYDVANVSSENSRCSREPVLLSPSTLELTWTHKRGPHASLLLRLAKPNKNCRWAQVPSMEFAENASMLANIDTR